MRKKPRTNDYAAVEAERAEAEAQLDAHEHHIADLQASIERLTEALEQARQELRDANRRTRGLQVELARTTRNATIAQRRRDANAEKLRNLDS